MLESLRKQIKELETDIEKLEERLRVKKTEEAKEATTVAAKVQARIFLERIFAPFMDGYCQEWGVSPEEALQILIKEDTTFGKIAKDNPKDLAKWVNQPEIRVVIAATRPLGNVSDEWIKDKMTVLLEVMGKIRPPLANAIITTPGGQAWFYDSLIGLRDILYGVPKLSHVPQLNIEG